MVARKSNQSGGIIATIFTTIVAPTLVALVTTAIKDVPVRPSTQPNTPAISSSRPATLPAVTLLPPSPAERQAVVVRSSYRWQPVGMPPAPTALPGTIRQY
jgi:hypothetical protein